MACNGCNKLDAYNWLGDLPMNSNDSDIVEVRFKNTRKEFFRNSLELKLKANDVIAVEASVGHDIGTVSLVGYLAEKQFKRKYPENEKVNLKSIYRKAGHIDIQTWEEAKQLEHLTMIKARQFALSLGLDMKISDVEFQGDKKKATFYYIAEGRVDFRELIKIYAEEFKVKIEMRQIGSRQEAGRIGGIGSCGRELCCSSWRSKLPTVPQNAIVKQNLPPGNEKYLGQCGKLKCCLMYELDTYLEARADFPKELLEIETKKGIAYPYKIDILTKTVWYSYQQQQPTDLVRLTLERVKEIIMLNKKGEKINALEEA